MCFTGHRSIVGIVLARASPKVFPPIPENPRFAPGSWLFGLSSLSSLDGGRGTTYVVSCALALNLSRIPAGTQRAGRQARRSLTLC